MSRTFSQRREARSFWSIAAGFVSIAAVTACSAGAGTTTDATTSQALSEATASAADTCGGRSVLHGVRRVQVCCDGRRRREGVQGDTRGVPPRRGEAGAALRTASRQGRQG
jgi:hypothetical protein